MSIKKENKKNLNAQTIGVIVNAVKKDASFIVEKIKDILKKYHTNIIVISYNINEDDNMEKATQELKDASMFISIGGDGTLLSALKIAIKYDVPVLPIYYGTLGFIAEIPPDEAFLMLEDCLSNRGNLYKIEERLLLSVTVETYDEKFKILKDKKIYYAVNEVVVSKPAGRPISLTITIAGCAVSHLSGDGVVVATPTGSTAYALSTGGPILSPIVNAISFTPIAPHSLTFRPLVIPKEDYICIEIDKHSQTTEAFFTIDGDNILKLTKNDVVIAVGADKICRIFQSKTRKFYDVLRDKLKWGL